MPAIGEYSGLKSGKIAQFRKCPRNFTYPNSLKNDIVTIVQYVNVCTTGCNDYVKSFSFCNIFSKNVKILAHTILYLLLYYFFIIYIFDEWMILQNYLLKWVKVNIYLVISYCTIAVWLGSNPNFCIIWIKNNIYASLKKISIQIPS